MRARPASSNAGSLADSASRRPRKRSAPRRPPSAVTGPSPAPGCTKSSPHRRRRIHLPEMNAERWQQLQDLFAAARSLPPPQREALLAAHAAADTDLADQVRALLAADSAAGVMDAFSPHLPSIAALLEEHAPVQIGPYRIVAELGRGGMGTVYLADRIGGDFEQRVAIKIIGTRDAGDPQHQRFVGERRILAALVHPNIARLLDGGLTDDGRPYLVMEHVDGVPITTFCDLRRLD